MHISNKEKLHWLYTCIKPNLSKWILYVTICVITAMTGIFTAITTRQLIDYATSGNTEKAIEWGIFFGGILLLQIITSAYASYTGVRLTESISNRTQLELTKQLLKTQWLPLTSYHSGDLQTRVTNDVAKVVQIWMNTIPTTITLTFQFIGAFITLAIFDTSLALFAFLITPIAILISGLIGQKLKKYQKKIQVAESNFRSFMNEIIQHVMILKAFQKESYASDHIASLQDERQSLIRKQVVFNIAAQTTMKFAYGISFFAAFAWGALKIASQSISFGTFTAFLQLVGQIQGPLDGLSKKLPQFLRSYASVERILELYHLETENDSDDKAINQITLNQPNLQIDDISFSYDKKNIILDHCSLTIPFGEHVVLVGQSGIGKTTLIRLLLSLLQPTDGSITLSSNTHTQHLSHKTRDYFTYVPQGDTLFSGTIRSNLMYGKLEASEEEMYEALHIACADVFVDELIHGLDTLVGENGYGLSQGQSQRITIARAILRNKPIIILDEATSSLDQTTELTVLNRLKEYHKAFTCITISHRTTVHDLADRVIRLKDGQIEE